MKFLVDNLYLVFIALASGGLLLWPLVKRGSGSASVSPAEATQLINQRNAIVVDVRDEKAFALGSITNARNLPSAVVTERIAELARFKARPVIIVCEAGQVSARAVSAVKAAGFDEVHVLSGGLGAWKQAGLPLVLATRDSGRPAPREGNKGKNRSGNNDRTRSPNKSAGRLAAPAVAANDVEEALVADATPVVTGSVVETAPASVDRIKEAS